MSLVLLNKYYVALDTADCPVDQAVATISLDVNQNVLGQVELTWNDAMVPADTSLVYDVYMNVDGTGWVFTDSTTNTNYQDLANLCADSVEYHVIARKRNTLFHSYRYC